jgi:hypothetical protein
MAQNNWDYLASLGQKGSRITKEEVRNIIEVLPTQFKRHLVDNGVGQKKTTALSTKFRDAGRRSAPYAAFSKKVPGRPQDGADGNRINRWLLPKDHKYYADEMTATLVEIKYFLQTLSMLRAPEVENSHFQKAFEWLTGHIIKPGNYLDPITLLPVDFEDFLANPRQITSGHLFPLDRGGKHEPGNTFLMTRESNMLQGNNTLPELLEMIEGISERHKSFKR